MCVSLWSPLSFPSSTSLCYASSPRPHPGEDRSQPPVSSPWGRVTQDPQASVDADHPNTASLLPQLLNWSLGLSALPGTLPASDLVTCHCAACLQPLSPAPFPPGMAVLPEGPVLEHHFFGESQRSSASLRLSHLPKVEPSPGQSRSLPHLLL